MVTVLLIDKNEKPKDKYLLSQITILMVYIANRIDN